MQPLVGGSELKGEQYAGTRDLYCQQQEDEMSDNDENKYLFGKPSKEVREAIRSHKACFRSALLAVAAVKAWEIKAAIAVRLAKDDKTEKEFEAATAAHSAARKVVEELFNAQRVREPS